MQGCFEQSPDCYVQRLALLAGACLVATAWLRRCQHMRPGGQRLAAALPVLALCSVAPLLFHRLPPGPDGYTELVTIVLVEFALTWICGYKVRLPACLPDCLPVPCLNHPTLTPSFRCLLPSPACHCLVFCRLRSIVCPHRMPPAFQRPHRLLHHAAAPRLLQHVVLKAFGGTHHSAYSAVQAQACASLYCRRCWPGCAGVGLWCAPGARCSLLQSCWRQSLRLCRWQVGCCLDPPIRNPQAAGAGERLVRGGSRGAAVCNDRMGQGSA